MNTTKLIGLIILCFTKICAALRNNPWGIPAPTMVAAALVVGVVVVIKLPLVLLIVAVAAFVAAAKETKANNPTESSPC